jgi:hypothetical protein
MSRSL